MGVEADLYLHTIDPLRYLSATDCRKCGFQDCGEWLEKLRQGRLRPEECPTLHPNQAYALGLVLSMDRILPRVEITHHPVAGLLGHHEINGPGIEAPVLVTGNAAITQEVMTAVLSTTTAPFHLLFLDTLGHTVDMAMIYGTFTARRLKEALEKSRLDSKVRHRDLILPGATLPLRSSMEQATGWQIHIGPLCVGELPLFLGEYWSRP